MRHANKSCHVVVVLVAVVVAAAIVAALAAEMNANDVRPEIIKKSCLNADLYFAVVAQIDCKQKEIVDDFY